MSKYIIINADDFGYNTEQNTAIKELLNEGLITSTSLMAVAEKAEDAVSFARENSFPVGVHLTINSDDAASPWQSISGVKSLGVNGLPFESKKLTFGAKRSHVRWELEAQYRFIKKGGAKVDHADNHCGTLYGINGRRFFIDAFDFCSEHSLPYRFPKTPGFLERQLGMKVPAPVIKAQQMIVKCGEKRGVKMLDDLVSDPRPMEKIKDYNTLRQYYLDAVDNCIDGVTEIFLHPAPENPSYGEQWRKRVFEYELLKSGDLLQKAEDKGIEVVSWSVFSR